MTHDWRLREDPGHSALLTDLYELTMLDVYHAYGMHEEAVFEFFVRRLPNHRNFLLAAGLEQALEFLESLRFTADDVDWLSSTSRYSDDFLQFLSEFTFQGSVDAMPEGTVFFADEPVLRVTAPMPQAQLVETRLINLLQLQTLIGSKAARCVIAAPEKLLVDFGLRRSHGAEAGLLAARASYIAGFAGSATVLAERRFGVPCFGTMAHSFVQAHDTEFESFARFARAQKDNVVLLIDTYDTLEGARRVVELSREVSKEGIEISAVRLDSGDMIQLSREVRRILDEGGCGNVKIFCSGGLDEHALRNLVDAGAPVDGFGIGTSLDVSADSPYLDCVYKLQEYAGRPRRKRSTAKETWPGRKQVYRHYDDRGMMLRDVLTIEEDAQAGTPLLHKVMVNGRRVGEAPSLGAVRERAAESLRTLPAALRALEASPSYPVEISDELKRLAAHVDAEFL